MGAGGGGRGGIRRLLSIVIASREGKGTEGRAFLISRFDRFHSTALILE